MHLRKFNASSKFHISIEISFPSKIDLLRLTITPSYSCYLLILKSCRKSLSSSSTNTSLTLGKPHKEYTIAICC
jgi:hypothetical protein